MAEPDAAGPPDAPRRDRGAGPVRRGRGPAIVLIFVGVSVLAVFALIRAFAEREEPGSARHAGARADSLKDLPVGWTDLPPPPEVPDRPSTAWTGDSLLVWGGRIDTSGLDFREARNTGWAYDARTGRWSEMPASPLERREVEASAWTGTEMLVWGGRASNSPTELDDGAAYDPARDRWRSIAPAPIGGFRPFSVWTGRELILWGSRPWDEWEAEQAGSRYAWAPSDGAAYDPEADSWRMLAEPPIHLVGGAAVWTGREMVVVGSELYVYREVASAAAYDPAADRWRRIPDPGLSDDGLAAVWTGREMIAVDGENHAAAFRPSENRWRELPPVPFAYTTCRPQAAWVAGFVIAEYCGQVALYDPEGERWADVSRHDVDPRWPFAVVGADPVVLMLGRAPDGGDQATLAYRPPEVLPHGPEIEARERVIGVPPRRKDRLLIRRLMRFAGIVNRRNWRALPLADEGVRLGLGSRLLERRTPEQLADRTGWRIDRGLFRGYAGPFSALDLLKETESVSIRIGPHDHCASPPKRVPWEVRHLRQISVQPKGWGTCLKWHTVDIFVDEAWRIHAVTMDLWEP